MTTSEDQEPMHCPYDGTELNRHAMNIRDPVGSEETSMVDPVLDGVPLEVHSCPTCGRGQPRLLIQSS